MIGVRGLSASLGGREVLRGVDFSAGPGAFVTICGPNGAGKTTLLRGLAGLLPGGRVDARGVAYLEQGARCAWSLTVAEAVTLGRIPWRDKDHTAIAEAMRSCGVAGLSGRRMDQLSGGQARRVMLARAVATGAGVLLLDEPVADLDPRAAHEIMRLLAGLAARGRCVVAVMHALELAVTYANRMLILADGRVLADGVPHDVLPAAAAAFGMELAQGRLVMPQGER